MKHITLNMNILFLNHKKQQCGVYQYGKRLFDILTKTPNMQYIYREIETLEEYHYTINESDNYNVIFYNYHAFTMAWLNKDTIQRKIKNIGLQHDLEEYDFFDIVLRLDITLQEKPNKYNILRPIFENVEQIISNYQITNTSVSNFINYNEPNTPIIGSFGFGFQHKNFDKVVELVNNQYENAIVKLLIPSADFGPNHTQIAKLISFVRTKITKPGIKLLTFHEFVTNEEILLFLKSNTINLFLYDPYTDLLKNAGLSSVTDYAISAKKPFGISHCCMFRHIYSDDICVYKKSIAEIIGVGSSVCEKFLIKFSNNKLMTQVENIIKNTKTLGIIPLGGNSTRMKNIPKYLLPCKIGSSLLDNTIDTFHKNTIFDIVAGVSKSNSVILEQNHKIHKIVLETKTMAETVYKVINSNPIYEDNYKNVLIMPDTYFVLNEELSEMKSMLNTNYNIVVIVWKIKDYQIGKVGQCRVENNEVVDVIDKDPHCDYPYFWGCIGWNSNMNQYINPEWETIGDLIKQSIEMNMKVGCIVSEGCYYDCGTFEEYFKMIKTEL